MFTHILRRLGLPLFFAILAASALQPASAQALVSRIDGQHRVGAFLLSLDGGTLRISHTAEPARILWASIPGRAFLGAAQGQADTRQFGTPDGSYRIDDRLLAHCLS